MKKFILVIFLSVILMFVCSIVALAEVSSNSYMLLSPNSEKAFCNNESMIIAKPLIAFDKTYVDMYNIADFLHLKIKYIEGEIGYFQITSNEKSIDFKLVNRYDDLNKTFMYFVVDKTIYISLREIADFAGYNIKWDDGIILLSRGKEKVVYDRKLFNPIDLKSSEDIVCQKYAYPLKYVVNPYLEYSYEFMMSDAQRLKQMYPTLIKTNSIGKTVEGRDLLLVEFGKGDKKIFICGTHHAREYIATTYLMYMIDRYAYMYATGQNLWNYNIKEILENVTFCIVPMVNPDGVNLVQNGINSVKNYDSVSSLPIIEGKKYGYKSWKGNVNGVDLNWNYDFDWNIERNKNGRGSTGFNGDYPNSEPEVQALTKYLETTNFEAFLSFHTQGQVYYWEDGKNRKTGIDKLVKCDTGFANM